MGSYEKVMPRNVFCLWSFFNVTETEISSKKRHTNTILVIRLSLQAFSSDLFMILGVFFLRYYEFNLKVQLEGTVEPRLHAGYLL